MLALHRKEGKDKWDILRLRKLDDKINLRWKGMDDSTRACALESLRSEDLIPQSWIDLVEVFGVMPANIVADKFKQ